MLAVRFDFIAQLFPSCGAKVVVSLSVKNPMVSFQRRAFAAVLTPSAALLHSEMTDESFRTAASLSP